MQSFFSEVLYAKCIAVVAVALFGSSYQTQSAASLPGVRSTKLTAAVSLAATVIAVPARPGRFFGVQVLAVADTIAAKAGAKGKSPAPIVVIRGPNGLTISSDDLEALDEFERLLSAAANGSDNGPMAVFYLKYGKAQEVAQELETILAGGSVDSGGSSDKGTSGRRLATGAIKITPEPRLNALLVLSESHRPRHRQAIAQYP